MLNQALAACAEFPNDNPALHRGALWFCAGVTAEAVCETPLVAGPEPAPVVVVAEEAPAQVVEVTPTDPAPVILEVEDALEAFDAIEVVDELVFEDAIDESPAPPEPVAAGNPFATLVRVLEDLTLASGGGDEALARLGAMLGQSRPVADASPDSARIRVQAQAWQAILCGESEDFAACGAAMLDEWSADVVARALGTPARADGLRRDLRRRGVAAFGLVEQAA